MLKVYSPDYSGKWGNIEFCDDFDFADLYVVFWGGGPSPYTRMKKCPPFSVLNFTREASRCIPPPQTFGKETIYCQWPTQALNLQIWGVDGVADPRKRMKHYTELNGMPFPEKTGLLSWITTGDYSRPNEKNRINFLKKFTEEYPGVLDLYGRNEGSFDLSSIDTYKGPVEFKRDALDPYEYTFAFENICEPNYMSEKFNDAILAGCIPIYWGMTNTGEYYPEGSFVEVDITKDDAPEIVMEVLESDHRERYLDALYEAKDLFLNKYQFWPTLHDLINRLIENGTVDLDLIQQRRNKYLYIY